SDEPIHGATERNEVGQPAAARSARMTNRLAESRPAGRSSPINRRRSGSRFSSPLTIINPNELAQSVGSVSETRGTKGSQPAFGTGTTDRSVTSTSGRPGKRDAV